MRNQFYCLWKTSWQWQPETYDHRFGSGFATDAAKVPPMIILTLSEPPTPGGSHNLMLLGVGN